METILRKGIFLKTGLLVFLFALSSHATTLTAAKSVVQTFTDPVNCQNIVDRLSKTTELARILGQNVVSATYDTSYVMSSWHSQLSPTEGRTVQIPYGYFDVMRQSASTASSNAQIFQGDFNMVDSQLYEIALKLKDCL